MKTILVTGGAGYIGSHMVKMLHKAGFYPITVDNLSTGYRDAVLYGEFVEGAIDNTALLHELNARYNFSGVMHFASFIVVSDSVKQPEKYFANNVIASQKLIQAILPWKVPFVFSSSAAIFGTPITTPISETHPVKPLNPYGQNKADVEKFLKQIHATEQLNYGTLRYFNAAGADPEAELGERHEPETHLIPLILQYASGRRNSLYVFGNDYPTSDGTCIRDYVHIVDLCQAHIALLDYLQKGGSEREFNLGTGRGYSVLEVIDAASKSVKRPIPFEIMPKREGDSAILVADGSKAKKILGWKPRYSDLETLLTHAWAWEQKLQKSASH